MHGRRPAWLFLLLVTSVALVRDRTQVPATTRDLLLALEQAWDRAVVAKDVAALERIMDPDFVFIDADGTVLTRKVLLERIQSPELVVDPFETHDVVVRVFGRTAILTGWFAQTGKVGDRAYSIRRSYTDVYVKKGTRWVAVSAHASLFPSSNR